MNIKATIRQTAATSAEGTARSHRVPIDRPTEKGGADTGMMGGEYLLVALGGCFTSNLLAAIAARGADIHDVRVDVTGTLGAAPARYESIDMTVTARHADEELLRKLVDIADRACIVSNTLRSAVHLRVHVQTAG